MSASSAQQATLEAPIQDFLAASGWTDAVCDPLPGDASARRYFRLRKAGRSAILMDASAVRDSFGPFVQIDEHLRRLGFSAPAIYALDERRGVLLEEDFGDGVFARFLDNGGEAERLYRLATDVLVALHEHPGAVPARLRAYHPAQMLQDLEVFLEWAVPGVSEGAKAEFRDLWAEVLPLAHQVPVSLLLRDYHVANLMWLPDRAGVLQAGLLDFQDAYQGPVTYDLMSLLEDARRDVAPGLQEAMVHRYLGHFPDLDLEAFHSSMAILAALRHTRVLAIFERLSRRDGKHAYKLLHSPRVSRLLQRALCHPRLAALQRWFKLHAR